VAQLFSLGKLVPAMLNRSTTIWKAVLFSAAGGFALAQFRILSMLLIALIVLLSVCIPRFRRKVILIPAVIFVLVTMFLPFDVALGTWHYGTHVGSVSHGPRFVRFFYGYGSGISLGQDAGEWISTGCCPPSMFPPRWILLWN